MSNDVYLVLDNVRSIYNVGSIFRIADGAGVKKLYLTGITAYPRLSNDTRKPWEIEKISKQIEKTALGAEQYVDWEYTRTTSEAIKKLQSENVYVAALEQTDRSIDLFSELLPYPIALVVGHERDGVSPESLEIVDQTVHIPMHGSKENLNVATATAVASYELVRRKGVK